MPDQKPTIQNFDNSDLKNEINLFIAADLFWINIRKILFFSVILVFSAGCMVFVIPPSYEVSGKLFSRTSLNEQDLATLVRRSDLIAGILTRQQLDNHTGVNYDLRNNILSKKSDSIDDAQSSFLLLSKKIESELTNLIETDSRLTLQIIEKTNTGRNHRSSEESEGRFMLHHRALMDLEHISRHGNAVKFILGTKVKRTPNAPLLLFIAFFGGVLLRFLGILFLHAKANTKHQKSGH